jgi:DNA-binding MarR family transcriptional regulator
MSDAFDTDPLPQRLVSGLSRLAVALRTAQWRDAEALDLTAAQLQMLVLLGGHGVAMRLSDLAARQGVSRPTASDSVAALERKGLVTRQPDQRDGRATLLSLSPAGAEIAESVGPGAAPMLAVAAVLPLAEQTQLLRLIIKLIRGLQMRGAIAPARICVTCQHFRPGAHPDKPATPHHCALVDAAFGDRNLRLDCREHDPAPAAEAEIIWRRFSGADAQPQTEGLAS